MSADEAQELLDESSCLRCYADTTLTEQLMIALLARAVLVLPEQ